MVRDTPDKKFKVYIDDQYGKEGERCAGQSETAKIGILALENKVTLAQLVDVLAMCVNWEDGLKTGFFDETQRPPVNRNKFSKLKVILAIPRERSIFPYFFEIYNHSEKEKMLEELSKGIYL